MEKKFVFIGLGNPGNKYLLTRHNIGFMVIDKLTEKQNCLPYIKGSEGLFAVSKNEELVFVKPQTYMNLSGKVIPKLESKFPEHTIVVIYDDVDLPLGEIRIRNRGSSGGHNGIKSILEYRDQFLRIRVGIGKKNRASGYVLEPFTKTELISLSKVIDFACEAIFSLIKTNLGSVMNDYNRNILQ